MCPLFCGILLALSLMLLGFTAVPLMPTSSVISDTISHFLPWYPILAFFVLVTGLLTPVSGPIVVASGLSILLAIWQLAPIGRSETGEDPRATLVILQANLLVTNQDMEPLRRIIDETQPDLIVLQEANSAAGRLLAELQDLFPHQHAKLQDQHSFGLAVASRQPIENMQEMVFSRPQIPAFRFIQKLKGQPVEVVVIHPANPLKDFPARRADYARLADALAGEETSRIVTGDFNATPFSPDYSLFTRRLALHNTRDIHGLSRHYTLGTWPRWLPAFFRLSIDHTLYTPDLMATYHAIPGDVGSDHLPTLTVIARR